MLEEFRNFHRDAGVGSYLSYSNGEVFKVAL